jgi:hypothetical protein
MLYGCRAQEIKHIEHRIILVACAVHFPLPCIDIKVGSLLDGLV